jgi:WD40 repeat protein
MFHFRKSCIARRRRSAWAGLLVALPCLALGVLRSPEFQGGARADGETDEAHKPVAFHSRPSVESVVFTPDGKRVIVGRQNGTIEVRSVPDGKRVATLHAPEWTNRLAVSYDGRILACANWDNAYWDNNWTEDVPLWDMCRWRPLKPIHLKGKKPCGIAFSPKENVLAIGTDKNSVVLWDLNRQAARKVLRGQAGCMQNPAFSSDGTTLACGGGMRWVNVWDFGYDYRDIQLLHGNAQNVRTVAFLPGKGYRVAIGGDEPVIRVVDAFTLNDVQTFRGLGPSISIEALVPVTSEVIVSAGNDATLRVWDIPSGAQLAYVPIGQLDPKRVFGSSRINCLALPPDGQTLVSGDDTEAVRFWDVPKLLRARGYTKPADCEKWRENFN